ncbi:MAG: metallophosphoesterase [Verrucomicrobiota bacterium]
MFFLDVLWWFVAARLSKRTLLRNLTALFMGVQITGFLLIICGRIEWVDLERWMPKFLTSMVFIWHFLGLGSLLVAAVFLLPVLLVFRMVRLARFKKNRMIPSENKTGGINRREFLGVAAATVPPLATVSLSSLALMQLNHFRVRCFELPVSGLPQDLEGLVIAHVSDIHVGRFTSGRVLREMVSRINGLRADLVLLTGDLINDSLSDLSEGIDLVHSMHARYGLCMIEGNHDLIENPAEFERRVRASGIPFLLDESTLLTIRGCPLQLLGLRWRSGPAGMRDSLIASSVRALLKQRREEAFPILMAHHPHAFDAAAAEGIPLILSGHTHGGQLMWNERQGFGPALYRYWSGLYEQGTSRMIVSNGVGNWFPLRVNAPAEIVRITLRRI